MSPFLTPIDHRACIKLFTLALNSEKVILLAVIPAGFLTLSAQFLRQTRQYFGQWKDTGQKGIAAVKEQQ